MKTIQRDGMTLVTASAFYKNDKEGGVGIHYPHPSKGFVQEIDHMLRVWDAYHETSESIHTQLKALGEVLRSKGTLTEEESTIAFVDIVWLESRGHLVPDNFNGGLWHWTLL